MEQLKTWPHLVLIAVVFAVTGGLAAALWVRHEQNVEAQALPNVARIERVDGQVGLNHSFDTTQPNEWVEVRSNMPLSIGDRLYTRDNSRAAVAFTGRNFARIESLTSLDVLALSDRRTQLALRDGRGLFDLGYLAPGDLFEVATPYGAVDLQQPGLYEIGVNDSGSAFVSVLSGLAQVVGLAGTGQISKGEMLTLLGQTAANVALSRLSPGYAGTLLNNYYSSRYPDLYDGRYADYNAYLNDPYYYDPYRRFSSYQYVSDVIPGLYDLDYYGGWQNVSNYGYCWHPNVDTSWAPYQSGYWTMDYPYGMTWVSTEPWGYAPYHYGRWANINNQWFWVPDAARTSPSYSPALVAFIPSTDANTFGWVPLAPSDPYVPRYYGDNWQPYYLNRNRITQNSVVNLGVPGAVTVIPAADFDRIIDPRISQRPDRERLAHVQPVLDPLAIASLRQTALRTRGHHDRFDVPDWVGRRIENTQVVTSTLPVAPRFNKDLTRALRVETVPARAKDKKLQIVDSRNAATNQLSGARPEDTGQQMAGLAREAVRGNREARRQMQMVEQQQRKENFATQRAQVELARRQQEAAKHNYHQQQQTQRNIGRQQAEDARHLRRNIMQQQNEARRQSNEQAMQRGREAAAQRAQQRQVFGERVSQPQQRQRGSEQLPQAIQQQRKQAAEQRQFGRAAEASRQEQQRVKEQQPVPQRQAERPQGQIERPQYQPERMQRQQSQRVETKRESAPPPDSQQQGHKGKTKRP